MNFEELSPQKKLLVILLIGAGLFLSVRLVYLAVMSSYRPGEAESMEEFRSKLQAAADFEKKQQEREWIKAGKPLPPGGFDVIWKQAHGQQTEELAPVEAVDTAAEPAAAN